MRASRQQQQALITLLQRYYEEIRGIEAAHGMTVGGGDYRARIEYFHDAVRALSSGEQSVYDERGRLAVEHLAYDISWLRHIRSAPLTPLNKQMAGSPSTQLVPLGNAGDAKRMDRMLREQLAEHYRNYAVLFAALFTEAAETNYHSRIEEKNEEVEKLAQADALFKRFEAGKASEQELENAAHHLDDPELRKKILAVIAAQRARKKPDAQPAKQALTTAMQAADRQANAIERAHFSFVTGQLAVYEEAKMVVKKLASEGLNVAGEFVQSAIGEAARHSRGR